MGENYNLFRQRLTSSTSIPQSKIINDKINSFKRALRSGYNVENIALNEIEFQALISSINNSSDLDRKSFSTLNDNNCEVGSILHWIDNDSHWIITEHSSTEKAIFQGYIDKASYNLEWKNLDTGIVYSQWACIIGPQEKSISDGTKNSIMYDMFSETLNIVIPKDTLGIELFNRYFEIMVNKRKWSIEIIDDVTNENLVGLKLIEVAKDKNMDSDTIVNNNIPINFLINSSLDNIIELGLNDSITINPVVYRNGVVQTSTPTITVVNCQYDSGIVSFNKLGNSIVTIKYLDMNISKVYTINIVAASAAEVSSTLIIGDATVKTLNTSTYSLVNLVNGVNIPLTGSWVVDSNYINIISQNNSVLNIKTTNKTGKSIIKYIDGINQYTLEIKIVPMFGGN